MLYETILKSPVGSLRIIASDDGLCAVLWPDEELDRVHLNDPIQTDEDHPIIAATVEQLNEYFDGDRTSFDLPLDVAGTDFQAACWKALSEIPYGSTISYGEQAAMIDRPGAARAVGAANGRNPVSIVVPCHRVVAADGALTGFAGGLGTKDWLLTHESANKS